jgi:uncharacterized protein with HEPN domain
VSRDWILYLDDILESSKKILRYVEGLTLDQFKADEKTYDAVVRNLEIIGEAAKNIPDSARVMMPDIEWRRPAGLRDIIAHAYFGIDDTILWDVIQHKVPELKQAIERFNERTNR